MTDEPDPLGQLAEHFVAATNALISATLMGNLSMYAWMSSPRLGDLVFVQFTRGYDAIDCVGTWVGSWSHLTAPDDEFVRDFILAGGLFIPRYVATEEVHGIETLDGRLQTWSNVELIRVPRDRAEQLDMRADAARYRARREAVSAS